jgi:acylaminoacyl-peptidase
MLSLPRLAPWLGALLLLVVPPALAQDAATPSDTAAHLQPIDIFDVEYASDPQIAPDGGRIVYTRQSMDVMNDRRNASLWVVNADGSGHRPLTEPGQNASGARWSPSGDRIAYVSSTDEGAEIFVRWMDTGQTAKLTQLTESPGGLAWSPDGSHLAFSMMVKAASEPFASMPPKPEGAEWAPAPDVVDQVIYRSDGSGYLDEGYTHLFVLPADGSAPRQITHGDYNHGGTPAWTPDGSALLFSANRHDDWQLDPLNSEIYRVNIASREITALTNREGPDGSLALSPSGDRIAYTGFDDREQGYQVTRLYVMNADGNNARVITPNFERDVQNPTWHTDGERIVFQYDDEGTTKIGSVTLDGQREELATQVGGTTIGRPYTSGSFSLASDGRFAFTHSTPQRPADVAVGQVGQEPRVLTALNEDLLGHKTLGAVEEFTYTSSHDGLDIEGWIVTPPDFDPDEQYPLLLEIHGGPFAAYGPYFSSEVQLYAAAGYVVLYTNPRGSTSYGQEFGNAIHHAYPSHDYDDLISGVDAVIDRGYIDTDRLYVTGGSGGGVLTAWIVGQTDRFRAAVSAKPVINWYSWALTADMYPYGIKYWFPGPPWEHTAHYMERSPISLVGNVTTPTMLLTGTEDYRTPMSDSEQYYQALQYRGVETALVRIPGASHGIAARPSQLIAKVNYILAWFERFDGPTP